MNLNKLMALAEDIRKPQQPKKEKPRYRYHWRLKKWVMIGPALVVQKPKPTAPRILNWPKEAGPHKTGSTCPHCTGTGKYRWHIDPDRVEKCFRCHGKGKLDSRDLTFLQRRTEKNEPICDIRTA